MGVASTLEREEEGGAYESSIVVDSMVDESGGEQVSGIAITSLTFLP